MPQEEDREKQSIKHWNIDHTKLFIYLCAGPTPNWSNSQRALSEKQQTSAAVGK